MRAIGDSSELQVFRLPWGLNGQESTSLCSKSLFKAKKLCIHVGKPQFNLLQVYASVPPLVGQNTGEMEGRNRRKISQIMIFFFFFNITFQLVLRLFLFPVPCSSYFNSQRETQNTRTQRFCQTSCCAQPESIWHHGVTKKDHPNKKRPYSPTNLSQLRWLE